jgi:ubiquitin-protein ligase
VDTATILIIVGISLLVLLLIIGGVVFWLQQGGGTRRKAPGAVAQPPQRSARRSTYTPPTQGPSIRPPAPPTTPGSTTVPHQTRAWVSGVAGVTAPEPVTTLSPSVVDAAQRLEQELLKLKGNGYDLVSLARRPDIEEYCLQVRVRYKDGDNASIHLICNRNYPVLPPELIVTVETIDARGEIAEQRLACESPVLQAWNTGSSLLAVVNNVVSGIPLARPDGSEPAAESLFMRYSTILA